MKGSDMDNEPTQPPKAPQTPDNPRTPEPSQQPGQNNNQSNQPGGYKKRPLWQWVVLYVIIAAIAYTLIYVLFMGNNSAGY